MSSNSHDSSASISAILAGAASKGVRVWSENGKLHYKAPKGALTPEELEQLRSARAQIISYFETAANADEIEGTPAVRRKRGKIPLVFSQLAHWKSGALGERPGVRQIASAMRLTGRVDVELLRWSLRQVVQRHDALRTRIVIDDGIPMQEFAEVMDCELQFEDLTALPEHAREIAIGNIIDRLILGPIQVTEAKLLAVALARLREDEYVLVVAMEHLISDAYSLNVFLRDLFAIYEQTVQGVAPSLPQIPVQFPEYATWQRAGHPAWLEKHASYWELRLANSRRLRFPEHERLPDRAGWANVPIEIDVDLKMRLRDWCRMQRTTLVMSIFAAYVLSVLRWCDETDGIFRYQIDGRIDSKLENTIGYFASTLYLRMALGAGDSFSDVLNRVTEEYCKAHVHADFSYLNSQDSQLACARNPSFNWVTQEPKSEAPTPGKGANSLSYSPIPFEHPMLKTLLKDSEPGILLYDTDDKVIGGVHFPMNRCSRRSMESFVRAFFWRIEQMLKNPAGRADATPPDR